MGGVRTDLNGATTLPRLYAAGEVACTGVHGANRLASNSLLEAVVFGGRSGRAMKELCATPVERAACCPQVEFPCITESEVRAIAWNACGILRNGPELAAAHRKLQSRSREKRQDAARADYEFRNIHQVATLISQAALAREESRGGHYRIDFPEKSQSFEKHSVLRRGHTEADAEVTFR